MARCYAPTVPPPLATPNCHSSTQILVIMLENQVKLSPSVSPVVSHALVQTVRAYVEAHEPHLPTTYQWAPKASALHAHLGLKLTGTDGFTQNLDLKRQLSTAWKTQPSMRRAISDYYVRVWGGIRRNAPEKIDAYTDAVVSGATLPFQGIASWSKITTAANPDKAAIFDARVSVSLNVLQVLSHQKDAAFFPILSSQNKLMKAIDPLLKAAAQKRKWISVPDNETYDAYLRLLDLASASLKGPLRIARAEMVLFAHAESLATSVLPLLPHP